MINDGANPLAEVALALAMAFFSLMILMLFAMVNAPKTDSPQASPATVDMALDPRDQPHGGNDRQLVIYTNAGFFDEQLNSLDPAGVDPINKGLCHRPGLTGSDEGELCTAIGASPQQWLKAL